MEDLRSKLREDLGIVAKEEADNRLRSELITKLIEAHDFEVPSALIELQARNLLNNFARDMSERGVDLNKVDKDFVQMAYTQMQVQAERDVRGAMLLEKVAELENVEISVEELNEEIERMAQYYRTTAEEIRNSLSQQQGGEANIANSLRTRKAIQALVDHAKITDGEWIDENQTAAEAEEDEKAKVKSKKAKKVNRAVEKKPKTEKKTEPEEPKKKAAKKE